MAFASFAKLNLPHIEGNVWPFLDGIQPCFNTRLVQFVVWVLQNVLLRGTWSIWTAWSQRGAVRVREIPAATLMKVRLAGAVATDDADAFAAVDGEVCLLHQIESIVHRGH